VVERIYEMYTLEGLSTGEITRRINAEGIPTPKASARWERSTVWSLAGTRAKKYNPCGRADAIRAPRSHKSAPCMPPKTWRVQKFKIKTSRELRRNGRVDGEPCFAKRFASLMNLGYDGE
jgi:hypothetical protein